MAGLGLALAACSRGEDGADAPGAKTPAGPPAVVAGMTMQEVRAAWGEPDVRVREEGAERWSYWLRDERLRVVGRTYVVFDAESRVREVVTRGPERPPPRPPPATIAAGPPPAAPLREVPT